MPMHPFHRTELLVGGDGWTRLKDASVLVVGLGGVGSYAVEALVRAGVGHLTLVDFDKVCITNVNRQLHSMRSTVGKTKAELLAARCLDINPKVDVRAMQRFYNIVSADEVLDRDYDFVLDCIDNMTAKIQLIERCVKEGRPVISAMGAGGRLDPTRIQVSDISKTHTDPLARIARDLLRQRGIEKGVLAVWSDEPANELDEVAQSEFRCICSNKADKNAIHACERRLQIQGSVSWIPSMFGLMMAGVVANRLLDRPVQQLDKREFDRMGPSKGKPTPERRRELLRDAGFERQAQ